LLELFDGGVKRWSKYAIDKPALTLFVNHSAREADNNLNSGKEAANNLNSGKDVRRLARVLRPGSALTLSFQSLVKYARHSPKNW
jgi:hypothetical protein